MPAYIFPSRSTQHVEIAVEQKLWAIHDIVARQHAARRVKASAVPVGAEGIFYVSARKAFTVPFIVSSTPEEREVKGIWPGVWHYPFRIEPLGPPWRFIPLARAKRQWLTLGGISNPTMHLRLSGSMAFVRSEIDDFDWACIKDELCA